MLLVVAYHLRPSFIPGGFVGVDVFFVISGFLIIGSLGREVLTSGSVRLARFYAHRARRLLPASGLVIIVTVVASVVLFPMTRWTEISQSALASALSVQNLFLAFGSSEYEAASQAVSPFQHFWSLSVEEQFYLAVPVLVVSTFVLHRKVSRGRRTIAPLVVVLAVLGFASLGWSFYYTGRAAGAAAYYSTFTRVWELVLGGLVALLLPQLTTGRMRWLSGQVVGWLGLILVVGSAFLIDGVEGFPGVLALVPTMGAVLILLSGSGEQPDRASVGAILATRLPVYIGDISYSLYLWHWPLIVFFAAWTKTPHISARQGLGLLLVSLMLSALSAHFVEERFRRPWSMPRMAKGSRRTRHSRPLRDAPSIALAMCLVLLVVSASAVPGLYVEREKRAAAVALEAVSADPRYPGARALGGPGQPPPEVAPVMPDPVLAEKDLPIVYVDGCNQLDMAQIAASDSACRYGATAPTEAPMILLGDSHAAQFVSPLSVIASRENRALIVLFKDGCPFSLDLGAWPEQSCVDHNRDVLTFLESERPSVVVMANLSEEGYRQALQWGWPEEDVAVAGFKQAWQPLVESDAELFYVRPIPFPSFSGPACVSQFGRDAPECTSDRAAADAQVSKGVDAAELLDDVHVVDLHDDICSPTACRAVEGNVLVFRDNHLSETYARTLDETFARQMGRPALR